MESKTNLHATSAPMKTALTAAAAALCLAATAHAKQAPAEKPDGSWLSLAGTVTSTTPSSFKLDHGAGVITVEMDDWDSYGDAYPLRDGDQVTVYGRVDKNLFAKTTIEAGSVYVEGLNTYFYASSADEEDYGAWVVNVDVVPGELTYIGTVASVSPLVDTFTIDTGLTEMTIDVSGLNYDPLDDEGFQKIKVGDRVRVDAVIDKDFFGDQDLLATRVVTLFR